MARASSFRINHNPRKAKSHRVYDDSGVIELYDICRNTLTNWINAGLRPAPDTELRLFTGEELNRFHRERRAAARRPSQGPELFCVVCRKHQNMSGKEVIFSIVTDVAGWLIWRCPDCGRRSQTGCGVSLRERLLGHGVLIRPPKEGD
jgi:hypothetical protein